MLLTHDDSADFLLQRPDPCRIFQDGLARGPQVRTQLDRHGSRLQGPRLHGSLLEGPRINGPRLRIDGGAVTWLIPQIQVLLAQGRRSSLSHYLSFLTKFGTPTASRRY
jgi:hypothetical protein